MNGLLRFFHRKDVIPEIVYLSKCKLYIFSSGWKIVMSQIQKINKKIFLPLNYSNYGNLVSTSIPLL